MSDRNWEPKPETLTIEEIRVYQSVLACGCTEERLGWWLCPYHLGFDSGAEAATDDLTGKLDAIHRPVDEMGGIWCDHDSQAWPCPTHRIVHGEAQR